MSDNLHVKSLSIRNFTVFADEKIDIGRHLNVVVGENGSGKTHLLKLIYSILSACSLPKTTSEKPTKNYLQKTIAEKLVGAFRPDSLGRLVRRKQGRGRCDVELSLSDKQNVTFDFATQSKSDVGLSKAFEQWHLPQSVSLPAHELLSLYPGFVSLYEERHIEYDETCRDLCLLLGRPPRKGQRLSKINELLAPLEKSMNGQIVLEKNGRFYLNLATGKMEIPLVAEGLRKLGTLTQLIVNGSLIENGFLFWDEPEANLNPRLIKCIAQTILDISKGGVQTFIATHSLFFMRQLYILLSQNDYKSLDVRFVGLHRGEDGSFYIKQGTTADDIGDIPALEEDLKQMDNLMELEHYHADN